MKQPWNHNIHFHEAVLAALPASCSRALDVGSGDGLLTRKIALSAGQTIGLERDQSMIDLALASGPPAENIIFVAGDFMTTPLPDASFDFISAIATLHHLPLQPALARMRSLLVPGGVLVIVGLYRTATPADFVFAAVGRVLSLSLRRSRKMFESPAPQQPANETLRDITAAANELLQGATVSRKILHRYVLLWHKPPANS